MTIPHIKCLNSSFKKYICRVSGTVPRTGLHWASLPWENVQPVCTAPGLRFGPVFLHMCLQFPGLVWLMQSSLLSANIVGPPVQCSPQPESLAPVPRMGLHLVPLPQENVWSAWTNFFSLLLNSNFVTTGTNFFCFELTSYLSYLYQIWYIGQADSTNSEYLIVFKLSVTPGTGSSGPHLLGSVTSVSPHSGSWALAPMVPHMDANSTQQGPKLGRLLTQNSRETPGKDKTGQPGWVDSTATAVGMSHWP